MSDSQTAKKQLLELIDIIKNLEKETAKTEALGKLGEGTIQTIGLVLNGIINLIGKYIEAWGRVATSLDPIQVAAFAFANLVVINYFSQTEPYRSILRTLRLLDLFQALGLISHGGDLPPPGVKPPGGIQSQGPAAPATVAGQWQIHIRYVGPYGPIDQYQYYDTQQAAATAADYYANHTAGNWILVDGPTQIPKP